MQQVESPTEQENKSTFFLKNLKELTSHDHLRLESNDLLSSMMSPQITRHKYCSYLMLMQSVSAKYEDIVSPNIAAILPAYTNHQSSLIIADDLEVLNYAHPNKLGINNYRINIDTSDAGQLLGFAYVMEGSRLGGRVIYKNIHQQLGFTEDSGAKYLADYGFATGSNWKKFITQLAVFVTDNNIEQTTITSAAKTFAAIFDFFETNRKFYEI